MKIKFYIILLFFVASCAPSKVCGGKGGKRCVDTARKTLHNTIS